MEEGFLKNNELPSRMETMHANIAYEEKVKMGFISQLKLIRIHIWNILLIINVLIFSSE